MRAECQVLSNHWPSGSGFSICSQSERLIYCIRAAHLPCSKKRQFTNNPRSRSRSFQYLIDRSLTIACPSKVCWKSICHVLSILLTDETNNQGKKHNRLDSKRAAKLILTACHWYPKSLTHQWLYSCLRWPIRLMMIIVKYSVKKLVIGIAREMELPVALATESLCTDYRKCDLFHSPITRPDETDGQSVIPVSYTHLTLPTIERCRSRWSPYH